MKKTRTDYAIKNTKYGFLCKIVGMVTSIVVRTVFVKRLGAEYLGVEGLFSNILTILSLAELGIGNVLTFSLYKPIAENNSAKVSAMISYYRKIYAFIAVAVLVIGLIFLPFLKYIVKSSFSQSEVISFYLFYLSNSVISYIAVCYTTVIKASQRQYIVDIVNIGIKLISSVFQTVVILRYSNFIAYLIVMIVSTLLQNIIASLYSKKRLRIIAVDTTEQITKDEKRKIVSSVKATFIYKAGVVIINYTDNILISLLFSTTAVGYYSNYSMISGMVLGFVSILCASIIPSIGNLSNEHSPQKSYILFERMIWLFHTISAVFFVGFSLLFDNFITLWLGPDNVLGEGVALAIAFSFYIQNVINPVWMYREAYGIFEQIKYLMFFTASLNIVFSIIGGKILGIAGVVGATGFSRLLTTVWYEPTVLHKEVFRKNPGKYYISQLKYCIFTMFSFIISYFVITILPNGGLFSFMIKGISTVVTVFFIMVLLAYNDTGSKYWIKLFLTRVRRKH